MKYITRWSNRGIHRWLRMTSEWMLSRKWVTCHNYYRHIVNASLLPSSKEVCDFLHHAQNRAQWANKRPVREMLPHTADKRGTNISVYQIVKLKRQSGAFWIFAFLWFRTERR
eukprot:GHVU01112092.1.p2 GENE.GHVU01112092.1~~GHVU01112092.1.p2  ORF type:complete len:113 (-),score=2.17 GHVU01112092.1:740-1078(-)